MQRAASLGFLDALRGLAAAIVVLSHFACAFYPNAILGDRYRQHSAIEDVFHFPPLSNLLAGHFAVCLFFVLSGFVLSLWTLEQRSLASSQNRQVERSRVIKAMVKRPVRLGGVVIASMAVAYSLQLSGWYFNQAVAPLSHSEAWFSSYWQNTPSASEFFNDLLLSPFATGKQYNPPLWTIRKELLGSYIVFFYLLLSSQFGARGRMALLASLFLIFFKTLYVGFVIGILLAEWQVGRRTREAPQPQTGSALAVSNGRRAGRFLLKCAVLSLAVYLSGQMHYVPVNFTGPWKELLHRLFEFGTGGAAMAGAVLIFVVVLRSNRLQGWLSVPVLQYLGKISYALYALHFILLGSLSCSIYLTAESVWGHHTAAALAVLATSLVLIPLAHLLTITVDRWSIAWSGRFAEYASKALPWRAASFPGTFGTRRAPVLGGQAPFDPSEAEIERASQLVPPAH